MDSFIQVPKSITKTNSVEKLEEKKRYEEDARKKREETLRLQTEEKRRYENTVHSLEMYHCWINI